MRKLLRVLRASLLTAALVLSASLLLVQDISLAAGQQATNKAANADGSKQDEQDETVPVKDPADTPKDDTSSGITVASAEAALDTLEKNSSLDSTVKDLLRPKYKSAIEALKTAADNAALAKQYQNAISSAPAEATKLKSQLEKLPTVDEAEAQANRKTEGLRSDKIQNLVNSQRNAVARLNDDLTDVTTELAGVKLRPAEINDRLPKAESQLSETSEKLASPEMAADAASPGRIADRISLEADESSLLSELELLKQEQQSQLSREDLLEAQLGLLRRKLENANAALKILETTKNKTVAAEAREIGSKIEDILKNVSPDDSAALELANEVKEMATELDVVVQNLQLVSEAQVEVTNRLDRLNEEYLDVTAQLKLGGGGDVIAQLLFGLQNRILQRGDNADLTKKLPKLDDARLAELETIQKVRRRNEIEKKFASRSSSDTDALLKQRQEVLAKLQGQQKTMVSRLSDLQRDNDRYTSKAETVLEFVYEQLFWIRSFYPVTAATMTELPAGIAWVFSREHRDAIGRAQTNMARSAPFQFYGFLFLIGLLLVMRGRIIAALKQTGEKTRRISTDEYNLTVQALFWTFLLAAPMPLIFAFLWWSLDPATDSSDWLRGVVNGLSLATWITLLLGFIVATCRPGGLGIAHFGWKEPLLKKSRKAIIGFGVVYVPALLVTFSTLFGTLSSQYGENVGRISFILAQVWTLFILWRLFRNAESILPTQVRDGSDKRNARMRYSVYALVLFCPVALTVLAWRGYVITAIELSTGLLATLGIVVIGDVLYWMALRWFGLKKRKLALAEALEKRRARREAAKAAEKGEPDEVVSVDHEDDIELDLDSISDQTRHLLRMVFSLTVFVAVVLFWSETIPIFTALERVKMPLAKSLTLFSAAQAVLIVVVTWVAVQNLPGLLELSVLRTTSFDKGTRYAISRICQYVVTAIGLLMLFNVLQVDWTQFGWIAAALSVGLGFGLQEVVANMVCGLILLFERPVRVGDIVTLDGMTGTVTRIQMRATTITNWDRQEFIVPNKSLITGTILNWTLSAAINRIVIPVGVAYGTDTEKARQILLSVATGHPLILAEPQPLTSFEQFADSSLTIILRAYLPDMDNRLSTITELHTEINKRFSEEGIAIAFPQVDLHFRNALESTLSEEGQAFPS